MNGSDGSLIRAIRGPITLITVGVLFALNNFTSYRFNQTWPVILIVFGLLSLLRRGTESVAPSAARPGFPPPPYGFPPADTSSSGYRQSSYTGTSTPAPASTPTPSGPAKGGFGTSAPPRPGDPGQTPGDAI
jgi:hypothetical protein